MKTLHLIHNAKAFSSCLSCASPEDSLVFCWPYPMDCAQAPCAYYFLEDESVASTVKNSRPPRIRMEQLIELIQSHEQLVNWG